jgi:hypothetical protein
MIISAERKTLSTIEEGQNLQKIFLSNDIGWIKYFGRILSTGNKKNVRKQVRTFSLLWGQEIDHPREVLHEKIEELMKGHLPFKTQFNNITSPCMEGRI